MWGRINWTTVIFGAIGIIIGYYLNVYSTNKSNQKLLADFKAELQAELQAIHNQQQIGRSTPEMDRRKSELETAIRVLSEK